LVVVTRYRRGVFNTETLNLCDYVLALPHAPRSVIAWGRAPLRPASGPGPACQAHPVRVRPQLCWAANIGEARPGDGRCVSDQGEV